MKLLNIRQLILVYYYITSWSQCIGYLMLMSQNSDTYQQHIDKPWNYYSNNNDEANIPSDEQYYDETNNAVYNDDNRATPYDYSVDEADAGNNYAEYEEAGTYYPTDDYHGNHYDDHSQYYAPIEYDDYYYYNDQTNHDDNIHYDEYDPRESSGGILMHHYHQSNHHHMERRHPYDGRQYNGYHEDDVEQNYYGNEGDYDHHDDQYNDHYNNPNYNNNNYYYDDDGYDNGDYSNYDVNDNDNSEDYGNFRDYSHQPIASYKHQKYIPHRLYNLKDYFPIDEKLYIFYPKDLKSQYYTVRTMEPSRYGQFHRYFEGELASKSVHGRFKEVYPMVYGEYTHFNHKIHDNNYNNNNHHHHHRHNYDYNQRQNHHKPIVETHHHHHHQHHLPNWHKHLPDEKFNQYENKEEIFNEIFGFGNSIKATDYEETISYHHTGQQDPKGKIRNYSNYDIYGRMKRSSKSELGGRFEKKYHTVIDTDKRKNRHTVSYIPLNDKSKYHRNHANQRRYSNAYHK
ncbi:unnamed protein product [Schistosoma turkestanicum]|nr:unnamed protein product [Schistosoma turkestanicum]